MTKRRCARKPLPVLISLYLLLVTISVSAREREFSREQDLPPLTLAAGDLDKILLKAQSFIAAANGPSAEHDHSIREGVKLGIRGREIEIAHFSLASSVAFPRVIFRFAYTYSQPHKPVSFFALDLGDYSRRVSARGEAADQVKTLSNLVEKDLRRYSIPIGGAPFRHLVGVCLSVGLLAFLGLGGVWWWRTRVRNALGVVVCSAISLSLLLFLPWNNYLPGFALYQSYSPFLLIKYAPYVAFFSLVASLIGIPLCYFLPRPRTEILTS